MPSGKKGKGIKCLSKKEKETKKEQAQKEK